MPECLQRRLNDELLKKKTQLMGITSTIQLVNCDNYGGNMIIWVETNIPIVTEILSY